MTRIVSKSMVASFHVQPSGRSVTEALQKPRSAKRPVAHSLRELEALQWPDAGLIVRDAIGFSACALATLRESVSRAEDDTMTKSSCAQARLPSPVQQIDCSDSLRLSFGSSSYGAEKVIDNRQLAAYSSGHETKSRHVDSD